MINDPIVFYLFTKYDEEKSLIDFQNNYLNFNSGFNHKLTICYKLINQQKIDFLNKKLDRIKFNVFIDPHDKNDFDFGSYKRFSEKNINRDILFLNSHSYPICNDWLKKLMKFKDENTLIGTSASYESLYSSIKLKKRYFYFSYLIKKNRFKKNFSRFPNPHVRTSSFFIRGKHLLDYIKEKKINNKEDTWKIESGIDSLTNYFKNKKFSVYVVNSDGEKFSENMWKFSETYNYLSQNKSIISDKHTRKYLHSNKIDQKSAQIKCWGS